MKLKELFQSKKGEMEIEEIVKLTIAILVFVLIAAGIAVLLSGKGSELLGTIKDAMRFGR